MKKATGELNMTVIVVVAIGVLASFFFTVIYPKLKANLVTNTRCNAAVCTTDEVNGRAGMVHCVYTDKKTKKTYNLECPFKG